MARSTLAAAAAALAAVSAGAAAAGSTNDVWPMPVTFNQGSATAYVDPAFSITCASAPCPDPLTAAFARTTNMIFWAGTPVAPPSGAATITGLSVTVVADEPLALHVSENYTLSIGASGVANLTADTQWGALRGLETFSKLSLWGGNSVPTQYAIGGLPIAIADSPRFAWRGILIDTSRHFLSVDTILSTLDAMSFNNLNVMHWHVVDDNSWPLYSQSYPNFTQAAYAPYAIYKHADVQAIADAAWERGIKVVLELDLPGHSVAWCTGYPQLCISCSQGETLVDPTPSGALYSTVQGLLNEFAPLLSSQFVHFGGDEVEDMNCWAGSPKVQAFMAAQGYTNVSQVRNYLESRLQDMALNMSITPMFWEEVADGGYTLRPSTVIDVWLSNDELVSLLKAGQPSILSYGLYLDQQLPPGDTHYFWADTALNFYSVDPLAGATLTPAQQALFLGMSASQWGEQVDDGNIWSRMWPRAAAAAERMWSPATWPATLDDFFTRIERQRCMMVRRGIPAGPLRPADETGFCELPVTGAPGARARVDWAARAPVAAGAQ